MAEQFTGMPGQYVPLKETLRGFRMILDGDCDDVPESCFLFSGTIDEVLKSKETVKEAVYEHLSIADRNTGWSSV